MADKEMHSRDLVVQKMTRDGLIEQNKTAGSSTRISSRAEEQSYDNNRPDSKFNQRTGNVKDKPVRTAAAQRGKHTGSKVTGERGTLPANTGMAGKQKTAGPLSIHDRREIPENPQNQPRLKTDGRNVLKQTKERTEQITGAVSPDITRTAGKQKTAGPPSIHDKGKTSENQKKPPRLKTEERNALKQSKKRTEPKNVKNSPIRKGTHATETPENRRKQDGSQVLQTEDKSEDETKLCRKLKFKTDEIKPYRYKRPRVRRAIVRKAEHKAFENEGDNLGLEGTHAGYRIERSLYRGVRKGIKKCGSKQSRYKRAEKKAVSRENKLSYQRLIKGNPENPDRRLRSLEQKSVKARKKADKRYKKAPKKHRLHFEYVQQKTDSKQHEKKQENQNKQQNNKNRSMQKQRYKRQYAKSAHDAKRTGETTAAAQKGIASAGKKLQQIILANKKVFLTIGAVLLVLFLGNYVITAAGMFASQLIGGMLSGTVQADYQDMTDCTNSFKQMEAELENRIKHIEEEFPDYDEYQYDLDQIGHDSMMLLSYLGAKYGSFTFEGAQQELVDIFNEMYDLKLEEKTEIRQKWGTVHDPITGEEKEGWEEYECRILKVVLRVTPLKDILDGRMDEEEKKQFDIYQESGGGQNIYPNPLGFDWHSHISSQFGYRIHPITGDLKFHSGVDIAAPEGTDIYSCMEGTVVRAGWSDSYGNFVEIQNDRGDKTKYAHCSRLHVSTGQKVKRRDKIAEVGSTGNSTGNHLHLEFISPDGTYLNPLFIVSNSEKKEE